MIANASKEVLCSFLFEEDLLRCAWYLSLLRRCFWLTSCKQPIITECSDIMEHVIKESLEAVKLILDPRVLGKLIYAEVQIILSKYI